MSRALPMAGFQLTLHGRIWVTPEDNRPFRAGKGRRRRQTTYRKRVCELIMNRLWFFNCLCYARITSGLLVIRPERSRMMPAMFPFGLATVDQIIDLG